LPWQQRDRWQAPLGPDPQGQRLAPGGPGGVRLGRGPKPRHLPAAQFWRLARRIGKKKAAIAVGHSILVIAWHLLEGDCDYAELGGDFFVRRDSDRARQRAVAQLQALGYHVTLQPAAA
jgi:hypothetical protein